MWPKIFREIFRFNKTKFWLLLILVLAALLRIPRLNSVPIELFGDELDVGYHALSLWQSGRDYMGQSFPIYLHSLNEWRAPLLMYVTAPFVGFLGLNEWGVRLPPAIFGLLSIFLIYLLLQKLTKNERLSLLAAFICAIVPWHIHYSRAAFESTLLLSLVLLGTIAFLGKKWFLAAISFTLSFYTYNTANIFVPLLILGISFLLFPKTGWLDRKLVAAGFLSVILCLPLFWTIIRGEGATRFQSINIFDDPKVVDTIVFKRTTGAGGIERVFHNKLTAWGKSFLNNYLTSFSPQFLFVNGDPNPRHNIPGFGEIYWGFLPFLLMGTFLLLKSKEDSLKKLVFLWLLLAPVPAALTVGGSNHATRLFLMIPPLVILVAYGLNFICRSSKFLTLLIALSLVFTISWFHEYFVHYPKEQAHYWGVGYKEALTWWKDHENEYSRLILNNEHDPILLRYLFWTKKEPLWLQENYHGDTSQKNILSGFNGFKVDSVFLGGISSQAKGEWLLNNLDEQTVFLAFQKDEIPGDWNWEKSPPKGIRVLKMVKEPFSGEPYIYLLTKGNK
jgi:4-amino-4-deoxy-L-arabinose transferase-like glycosyltransferase